MRVRRTAYRDEWVCPARIDPRVDCRLRLKIETRVETGVQVSPGSPRKPTRAPTTDGFPASSIDEANRDPVESEKAMLTKALIVNGLVLFAVLEADLGPGRKVSRFRLLRPLLMSASIVPLFLEAVATHGTGLALEIAGGVAGVLLGLTAASLMTLRREPATGRVVTRAGAAYAALWIAVIAARSCFSIGAVHWFNHPLATWMANHQVTAAAITDTLIIMAVAMTLARTATLALRANQIHRQPAAAASAA
jgi:hypothetical protein